MVRKKWIVREDLSEAQEAVRTVKFAVLKTSEGKLNSNQQTLIDTLAAAGGKVAVEALQSLEVPRTTLSTLVKRGLVEIVEEAAEFTVSVLKARPSFLDFAVQSGAAGGAQIDSAKRERAQVFRHTSARHHWIGQDRSLSFCHAVGARSRTFGHSAGSGNWSDSCSRGGPASIVRRWSRDPAFGLSDKERAEQWHRIKRGDARMVVGTRSAVFAPVSDLALVIVDEEQDPSYKQEEMPRYHARDVAVMRAKMANAAVVLGSATPSLESYFNAKKGKYKLLEMPDRVEQRPLPEVEIIDMRQEFQETGSEQVISRKLAKKSRSALNAKSR